MICGDTKTKKEEANILHGARKPRKDEEMACAPPRNMSNWPDWEESEWRLEPEEKRSKALTWTLHSGPTIDRI